MASRDENILKIKSLKNDLSQSEKCRKHYENLLDARKKLEGEIEKIKENIEQLELNNRNSFSQKNLLEDRLSKMQNIDHRLDYLEEWTDVSTPQIQKELISLILTVYPEESKCYEDLCSIFCQTHQLQKVLIETQHQINRIIESLRQALKVRAKVKRKGVFCYILGPNPNIQIGKELEKVFEISEKILENYPDLSQNLAASKNLKNQYRALESLLSELSIHCQSRWGFKTLDNRFTEVKEKLELFSQEHTLESDAIHRKLLAKEAEINAWIEKHC